MGVALQAAGVVGRDVGVNFEKRFCRRTAGESGVLGGENWVREEAPANHDSRELRVVRLDILNLLEVGDVSVKNQRVLAFAVEFVKSLEVKRALVLLDSDPRVKGNVGEESAVQER